MSSHRSVLLGAALALLSGCTSAYADTNSCPWAPPLEWDSSAERIPFWCDRPDGAINENGSASVGGLPSEGGAAPTPLFQLTPSTNGVANLDQSLTINSITVEPTFVYYGGDANATNLTAQVGETLTAQGSGGTFNAGSPLLGADDDSLNPDDTRYYQASNGTFANITTEDFVLEAVVENSGVNPDYILGTFDTTGGAGWVLYSGPAGRINGYIDDGPTGANIGRFTDFTKQWVYILWVVDRSGTMRLFVNELASGTANVAALGSIVSPSNFSVGASGNGQNIYSGRVAYAALWARDNWLDTDNQAALHKERFQRLMGLYPQIATGTSAMTFSRASPAAMDKTESGEQRLYRVGQGWPRVTTRGGSTGYYGQTAATNLHIYSDDFTQPQWVKTSLTVTADTTVGPDNTQTADTLFETNATTTHQIHDDVTLSSGVQYCFSIYAADINRDWVYIRFRNTRFGTTSSQFFDVANGVKGSLIGSVDAAEIEGPFENGFYRIWVCDTTTSAGSGRMALRLADADGSLTYTGLNQDAVAVWGGQTEAVTNGGVYPSCLIYTSGTTVTRQADVLYYTDGGNLPTTGEYTLSVNGTFPPYAGNKTRALLSLDAAGSANNRVGLYGSQGATAPMNVQIRSGAVTVASILGTTDFADGTKREARTTFKLNDAHLYVDLTEEGTPDTSMTLPIGLDRIYINSLDATNQGNGVLINNVRIWDVQTLTE